jgi:LPXTG-motif cell wall-anchored protein
VTVDPVDDPPVAVDDVVSTDEDVAVVVDVLANDSDADGDLDPTSVSVVSGPTNGSVTVDPVTGEVTYVPDPDFAGSDEFTYQVCDTAGSCDVATVDVVVDPAGDPPVANDDTTTVGEDGSVMVPILDNDTDPDGDLEPTSVVIVAGPANGTVTVDPVSGTVTYVPDPDFAGGDEFTYEVCDATGACDQATVSVIVVPSNDAPVYVGPTTISVPIEGTPPDLAINEPDGDPFTVVVVDGDLPPGITLDPDGSFAGSATVAGSYPLTLETCDNQSPPACTVFSVTLAIENLPATGFQSGDIAILGLALLLGGTLLVLVARDPRAHRRRGLR